jgi:hypothetical protein
MRSENEIYKRPRLISHPSRSSYHHHHSHHTHQPYHRRSYRAPDEGDEEEEVEDGEDAPSTSARSTSHPPPPPPPPSLPPPARSTNAAAESDESDLDDELVSPVRSTAPTSSSHLPVSGEPSSALDGKPQDDTQMDKEEITAKMDKLDDDIAKLESVLEWLKRRSVEGIPTSPVLKEEVAIADEVLNTLLLLNAFGYIIKFFSHHITVFHLYILSIR